MGPKARRRLAKLRRKCGHHNLVVIKTPHLVHYAKELCRDCGRMMRWVPKAHRPVVQAAFDFDLNPPTSRAVEDLPPPAQPRGERPLCSKCGQNVVYAAGGPHMDWCEPCLWAHIDAGGD